MSLFKSLYNTTLDADVQSSIKKTPPKLQNLPPELKAIQNHPTQANTSTHLLTKM